MIITENEIDAKSFAPNSCMCFFASSVATYRIRYTRRSFRLNKLCNGSSLS